MPIPPTLTCRPIRAILIHWRSKSTRLLRWEQRLTKSRACRSSIRDRPKPAGSTFIWSRRARRLLRVRRIGFLFRKATRCSAATCHLHPMAGPPSISTRCSIITALPMSPWSSMITIVGTMARFWAAVRSIRAETSLYMHIAFMAQPSTQPILPILRARSWRKRTKSFSVSPTTSIRWLPQSARKDGAR